MMCFVNRIKRKTLDDEGHVQFKNINNIFKKCQEEVKQTHSLDKITD